MFNTHTPFPAFLGSGHFLASPDPHGPDEDSEERWEDDGGPCPPDGDDC